MRAGAEQDIVVGQPLPHAVHDAHGRLLMARGAIVASEGQRLRLLERGFLVDDGAATPPPTAAPAPRAAPTPVDVFERMRDLATDLQAVHDQLLAAPTPCVRDALVRKADRLMALADRDPDAALASMQLYVVEEGLAPRLLHAAVLCHLLTRALGMDEADRRSTVAAALTYDVALTPHAGTLNRQCTPLTPVQRAAIDGHPAAGHALLRQAGVDDAAWLRAVMEHHERVDGSGYPARLSGEAIGLPARVVGIVDSFSAMVRPRGYRDAVLCREALRDIFLARSRSVDERIAHLFIREIGLYPPGTLVRLGNGETAVVARRDREAQHPDVRRVLDAGGARVPGHPAVDTHAPGCEVVEGVPLQKFRILESSLHAIWCPA